MEPSFPLLAYRDSAVIGILGTAQHHTGEHQQLKL
jgi:hypothetical protein